MRTKILTSIAAAAVAAGTLSLATPPTPAHAAAWTHIGDISSDAVSSVSSRVVDVVAYGDGFAAAVWFENDGQARRLMASRFLPNLNGGQWLNPTPISTAGRNTYDPVIEVNAYGDLVAAWSEVHDGIEEVYGAVQPVGQLWSAPQLLTPTSTNVDNSIDVGIADDRTVYVGAEYTDTDDVTFGPRVVRWDYPANPDVPIKLAANGGDPSVDVSGTGEVIVAFKNFSQGKHLYTRHSPGSGWTAAVTLGNYSAAAKPEAAIDNTGRAAVAYAINPGTTIQVQLIDPAGTKHGPVTTLPGDIADNQPAIDINGSGRLFVAWPDTDAGDPTVSYAKSSFGGAWTTVERDVPTPGVGPIAADVSDSGAQAIGYAYGGQQVVLHRPRTNVAFGEWESPGGYADHQAIGIDAVGNVVAIGIPQGAQVPVHARYLDAVGPKAGTTNWPIPLLETGRALTPDVSFDTFGHDWLSGLESIDVVGRIARWNEGTYGPRKVLKNDQPAGTTNIGLEPGTSYCVGARGTDGVGNIGAVSQETCFTTPLDDRAFTGTGWSRVEGDNHYLGTLTTTQTKGRFLLRKGVRAKHLALVVAKAPNGGKVQVKLGENVLGNYSLEGTGAQQVIEVATFAKVRTGALRITVISTGKPVRIDGVEIDK